jgi:hypothetical protein
VTEPPIEEVNWLDVVAPLVEAAEKSEIVDLAALLKSETMFNANYGVEPETLRATLDRIDAIVNFLLWTRRAVRGSGELGGKNVATAIQQMEHERQRTIKNIVSAAWSLRNPYQDELFKIAARIRDDRLAFGGELLSLVFEPSDFGRRGAPVFASACTRRLDKLIRPSARNRYTTIAQLLAFIGISRSAQLVRSTLKT